MRGDLTWAEARPGHELLLVLATDAGEIEVTVALDSADELEPLDNALIAVRAALAEWEADDE